MAYERPRVLKGFSSIIQSGCGRLHVTVNFDGKKPMEIYVRGSSTGGCQANLEVIGRLSSRMLQCGVPVEEILKQMHTVKCAVAMRSDKTRYGMQELDEGKTKQIKSCADGIAKAVAIAMNQAGVKCDS